MNRRLFVGIPLSKRIKVISLLNSLREVDADMNLVSSQNLHFTVKYLAEVDESKILEIKDKLNSIKQIFFTISLKKVGVFPSLARMNVIWIGVEGQEFISLIKKVNEKYS